GVTHAVHTHGNTHGLEVLGQIIRRETDAGAWAIEGKPAEAYDWGRQFIFVNLVDTDMKFGHRRDVPGYAKALEEIDAALGGYLPDLGECDLLIITGDHGCDPTAPGSDHTREYAPALMYAPALQGGPLAIRESFADIGQTVLDWLSVDGAKLPGKS